MAGFRYQERHQRSANWIRGDTTKFSSSSILSMIKAKLKLTIRQALHSTLVMLRRRRRRRRRRQPASPLDIVGTIFRIRHTKSRAHWRSGSGLPTSEKFSSRGPIYGQKVTIRWPCLNYPTFAAAAAPPPPSLCVQMNFTWTFQTTTK